MYRHVLYFANLAVPPGLRHSRALLPLSRPTSRISSPLPSVRRMPKLCIGQYARGIVNRLLMRSTHRRPCRHAVLPAAPLATVPRPPSCSPTTSGPTNWQPLQGTQARATAEQSTPPLQFNSYQPVTYDKPTPVSPSSHSGGCSGLVRQLQAVHEQPVPCPRVAPPAPHPGLLPQRSQHEPAAAGDLQPVHEPARRQAAEPLERVGPASCLVGLHLQAASSALTSAPCRRSATRTTATRFTLLGVSLQ
jgi:hypothetical protein